jgi:hypothetical protein
MYRTYMFKMCSHDPFGHLKHKLRSKEGPEVKLTVWLPTTKSQESPRFPCVKMVCDIPLKSSWRGIQLFLRPHFNQRYACKVTEVPILGISRLPFGSPGTKCHLDVGLMERHKVYYKGEGDGFPQVWAVVNLVNPSLPVFHPNTKVFRLCSNQLIVWFV